MNGRMVLAILFLILIVSAAFYPALWNDFTTFDDNLYVTANAHVRGGLTPATIRWAFTTGHAANWHPLTWLSHLADYALFGMNPAGHHLSSLVIHAASAVVLFLFLSSATGAYTRSLIVAALFAAHPLRVESVAWIAERKDVLSGLFGMASLWAYVAYAHNRKRSRYVLSLALFVMGLLAKPMLVTFPLIMLLLDRWPLHRKGGWALVREKTPFFAAAAISSAITVFVQARGGAVGSFEEFPLTIRLANAAMAYAAYIGKIFVPIHLAVFYPHPGSSISFPIACCLAVLLLGATLFILFPARNRPYLAMGWLWFGIMLLPVIGIIQIGDQAHADRYTYLPSIGLCIAAVWLAAEVLKTMSVKAVAAVAVMAPCIVLSNQQTRVWRNTESLFQHTLAVTGPNKVAHMKLGCVFLQHGQLEAAAEQFEAALAIDPRYAQAMGNRGMVLLSRGKPDEARLAFETALQWQPGLLFARTNLGIALFQLGRIGPAFDCWNAVLQTAPNNPDARFNRAVAFLQLKQYAEAEADLVVAYKERPWDSSVTHALGVALLGQGKTDRARHLFEQTLRLDPNHVEAAQTLEALRKSAATPHENQPAGKGI
ncbi:MAG TPA: tetratricopeptide repeat protein [Candidatus Hydrogenedentes bacterium]|nr:tetratricopeptide repeat protein [Candidatus Hydrogenedentota bacterium]